MAVMDDGCIEIGNINTKASSDVIRKLKFILDEHGIFHIIDGVMFFRPHAKAARMKEIHQGRAREVNASKDDIRMQYRELIVPDLYELNYMSLIYLDSEEAEFLSTLIYGKDRRSEYQFKTKERGSSCSEK
jgi:hypothetical protein